MQHDFPPAASERKGRALRGGFAKSLVKTYDRSAIKAGRARIKEWDYYLIYNDRFGVALTIDDNSYMGCSPPRFWILKHAGRRPFPDVLVSDGQDRLSRHLRNRRRTKALKHASASFTHEDGGRRLKCHLDRLAGTRRSTATFC
jgi:hypothetical protein